MDESTTGKRLRKAIEEGPGEFSVRGFQEAMEERLKGTDVRGYTYPSINSYLHDETSPSIKFLEHAANVLGVRHAWLATCQGDMTEEEGEVERISEAALRDAEGAPAWKRRVRFKWDVLAALGVSPPDMSTVGYDVDEDGYVVPEHAKKVMDAWAESVNASQIPAWLPPLLEVGRRLNVDALTLGRALRGPLAALDLDADAMTREELGDYISAMIPVLLTLEPHHEEED